MGITATCSEVWIYSFNFSICELAVENYNIKIRSKPYSSVLLSLKWPLCQKYIYIMKHLNACLYLMIPLNISPRDYMQIRVDLPYSYSKIVLLTRHSSLWCSGCFVLLSYFPLRDGSLHAHSYSLRFNDLLVPFAFLFLVSTRRSWELLAVDTLIELAIASGWIPCSWHCSMGTQHSWFSLCCIYLATTEGLAF